MRYPASPARPLVVINQLDAGSLRPPPGVVVHDDAGTRAWQRCGEAEVLLTAPRNGWRDAPRDKPDGWPGRLRWVHLASAGIDYFPDWLFAVPQVTCARGVAAAPIAEYVMTALLDQVKAWPTRQVRHALAWRREFDRACATPIGQLAGQTLGLVGFGAIGQAIAQRALAFGMQVSALRRTDGALAHPGVARAASLHGLLAASDHVVLALPSTPATRHIIDAQALQHARPGQHLVNIARGALIDHGALREALDRGPLACATLDVTEPEPPPHEHWLYSHPRVRLTPHLSWSAGGVSALTLQKFDDNLHRYLAGQPLRDVVDPTRGY
ncbi:NAD(P)-dependent oxidoreductase [Hydrogenophaga sp. OTU3427]|uniref:NAD(P)-dependent oxidoreductase n=1 Tax=Hydrogenophaga sp. OTU3427 TaxID=3043856 RepID=UPI00313ED9EE